MTIYATYDPADDKLRIYSDSKLCTSDYERVKGVGYSWAPMQKCFFAHWDPKREDVAYELAGDIEEEDGTPAERAVARSKRFAGYAERRAAESERAQEAVAAIADNIPLGQPILVGHHSERHARKDAERIENGMRRAVKLWETSKYWKDRAARTRGHAEYLERPEVRARRIKTLEADLRGHQHRKSLAEGNLSAWRNKEPLTLEWALQVTSLFSFSMCFPLAEYPRQPPASQYEGDRSLWSALQDGTVGPEKARDLSIARLTRTVESCRRWIEHLENRLVYERGMLEEDGGLAADKFDLQPGGRILRRGQWYVVSKVNRKAGKVCSVSVIGHFRGTVQVEEVQDYTPPAEGDAAKVKAATKQPPLCNYPGEGFRHMTRDEWEKHKFSDFPQTIRHKATEVFAEHRTRATHGGGFTSVAVYLTTDKRIDPPPACKGVPAVEPPAVPLDNRISTTFVRPRSVNRPVPTVELDPASKRALTLEATFEGMKQSLEHGVQVVQVKNLFATPHPVAVDMVKLLALKPGMTVLEPSAGSGAIARVVRSACPEVHLDLIEINRDMCLGLHQQGFDACCFDFMNAQRPICPSTENGHDRIVMNPPFDHGLDIQHIKHAIKFLAPGGRLVALCCAGPRQEEELIPLASTWRVLPPETFAGQGTRVKVAMLTIEAPLEVQS